MTEQPTETFDFSKPETKALYESEVRKRMDEPFCMSREQAEMLVAVLMSAPRPTQHGAKMMDKPAIFKKCSDPQEACVECNGFGILFEQHNPPMHVVETLHQDGKHLEIYSSKIQCKSCLGTGRMRRGR